MSTAISCHGTEPELRRVQISSIRLDGNTQHRSAVDPAVVADYTDLILSGVIFPPIRVWWDGSDFWLSDGFQRVEASNRARLSEIDALIMHGTLSDARWDSYAANAVHGVRRNTEETQRVIRLAIAHPNAAQLSNVQLAKHLHLSEATLRRWRNKLASPPDDDQVRLVRRGSTTYRLATTKIGRNAAARHSKSTGQLRVGLKIMKQQGSSKTQRVLNALGNWMFGCATNTDCLNAIERVLREEN